MKPTKMQRTNILNIQIDQRATALYFCVDKRGLAGDGWGGGE